MSWSMTQAQTRKKLLNLLPTLVSHQVIDTEKKRYRICNHAGETSNWRQVARSGGTGFVIAS